MHLGKNQKMSQGLVPLPPAPRWNPRLLVSAGLSSSYCHHLWSEPANRSLFSPSLCTFAFRIITTEEQASLTPQFSSCLEVPLDKRRTRFLHAASFPHTAPGQSTPIAVCRIAWMQPSCGWGPLWWCTSRLSAVPGALSSVPTRIIGHPLDGECTPVGIEPGAPWSACWQLMTAGCFHGGCSNVPSCQLCVALHSCQHLVLPVFLLLARVLGISSFSFLSCD